MTLEISSWDRFAAIRAENRTDIRLKENTTKIKILVYGLVFGLYFKRRQGGGGGGGIFGNVQYSTNI